MLERRYVDAVLVEPLEEGQQVRAGLVALLGDALLVVRDAQRRLCVGSTGGLSDSSMASRLTRKMIATRRRTDEDEEQPRCYITYSGAHVRFLLGAQMGACGHWHNRWDKGSGSSKEQAESGQSHCGRAMAVRTPLTTTCAAASEGICSCAAALA